MNRRRRMDRRGFLTASAAMAGVAALLGLSLAATTAGAAPAVKALIVDGQNNHNWKADTPVLKEILLGSGFFQVDVATSPPRGKPMAGFRPDFAKYGVVVSNYNGAEWPAETKAAFVKYMTGGGGLVIVHAADNSFPRWVEFNEMIGLGGWGGRNEKSGPYVYWKDGKYVRDTSKGSGGHHGAQTPYVVEHRDTTHPITKGLPAQWMHAADELYCRMRGPAKNMTILATAFSDPKTGGSGRHEPVLWTVAYGKGRVFHTVLGHSVKQLRCVGFMTTFLRGAEWAATGQVTQTAVPEDFPTKSVVSVRAKGASGKLYEGLAAYKQGDSRAQWIAIDGRIRSAGPAMRKGIEAKLLAVLSDPKATFDSKQYVCRFLRRIGTDASVGPLAKLLRDKKLSHMARFALQDLPGDRASEALRAALAQLDGDLRLGMIDSIGRRGDAKAIATLAKLAGGSDQATAAAAISALGHVGGTKALAALAGLTVPKALSGLHADAELRCADALLGGPNASAAAAVYRRLAKDSNPTIVRIAAYRGLAETDRARAVPVLLSLLKDKDLALQRAAGKCLIDLPGSAATKALAAALPSLSPNAQMLVLTALTVRGDKSASPAVTRCVASGDEAVSLSAIRALGVLGGAESVELLSAKMGAGGEVSRTARAAMERLGGNGVGPAMAKVAVGKAPASVRSQVIEALIARRDTGVMDAYFQAVGDSDRGVRQAGLKAIGILAGAKELPRLVALLIDPAQKAHRGSLGQALGSVVARSENTDAGAGTVIDALARADHAAKGNLLGVLPRLGGDKALGAVRKHLGSDNAGVKTAAIRALSDWPDAAPMADLLTVAKNDSSRANQVLALRGYVKMLSIPANRSSSETVAKLAEALALAKRPQERKAILAALERFPCEAALQLANSCMSNPELSGEASLARQKIKSALVKRAMNATAEPSGGGDRPSNALDGKANTRWSTGRPMAPGNWFQLDLGREATVRKVTLDTQRSRGDYPRGYEVYVSFDGKTWGKPVLVGKGEGPITVLAFKEPLATRYIKIVQTGRTKGLNWSIHELTVDMK